MLLNNPILPRTQLSVADTVQIPDFFESDDLLKATLKYNFVYKKQSQRRIPRCRLVNYKMEDWHGLVVSNLIILIATYAMEKYQPRKSVLKKMLTFTASGLHVLNNNKLLLEEVRTKTNIDVFKVEIIKISDIKNEVTVWIYFKPSDN